jgi:hypothetical protein
MEKAADRPKSEGRPSFVQRIHEYFHPGSPAPVQQVAQAPTVQEKAAPRIVQTAAHEVRPAPVVKTPAPVAMTPVSPTIVQKPTSQPHAATPAAMPVAAPVVTTAKPASAPVVATPVAVVKPESKPSAYQPVPTTVRTEARPAPAQPVIVAAKVETKPATAKVETKPTATEVAKAAPTDWRSSWGKPDDHKSHKVDDQKPQKPVEDKPLPHAAKSARDPLTDPNSFARRLSESQEKQAEMVTGTTTAAAAARTATPRHAMSTASASRPAAPAVVERTTVVTTQPSGPVQTVPLGAQSVLAAGGSTDFVPVPVVALPTTRRVPEQQTTPAPQPVPPSGMAVNAFTPPQTMMAGTMVPAPVQPNAFTPAPAHNGAQHANAFVTPEAAVVAQVAFNPAMDRRYLVPQQPAALTTLSQETTQLLATLRDSLYPSQREWAAEKLTTTDWRTNPDVVAGLVTAAREDPSATVRAGCVRCLAKMSVTTAPVLGTVEALKMDPDPRVRQEAERAATALGTSRPAATGQSMQPVGFTVPGRPN